jgi:Uma2 family endonuclease
MTGMVQQSGTTGSRPFTVDDLEGMPDDGRRYELIDGILLVSPAPGWSHQSVVAALGRLLDDACPPDLRALIAPFALRTALDSEVQPDVLVARYADLTERNLPVAPLLAAEVLSPSTQLYDRNLKLAHYARVGVESYWLVDPMEPGSITAYRLTAEGNYTELAFAAGEDALEVDAPFPLRVVPARLRDRLLPPS